MNLNSFKHRVVEMFEKTFAVVPYLVVGNIIIVLFLNGS